MPENIDIETKWKIGTQWEVQTTNLKIIVLEKFHSY